MSGYESEEVEYIQSFLPLSDHRRPLDSESCLFSAD